MTDSEMPNELPGWIKPWINLIHTIGLPWVIIILSAYYGIPFANDSLRTLKNVAAKMDAVSNKVDSAILNLESIHRTNISADRQRHADFAELKEITK